MRLKRLGTSAAALLLAFTAGCGAGAGGLAGEEAPGSGLTRANFASEVTQAQADARTAHLEATMDAQGQQVRLSGDMDMSGKDVAFDLAMRGSALGGDARLILVDRVLYLQMPGLSQGRKFLEIDASRGGPAAKMFDQMMGRLDPSRAFDAFGATKRLEEKGTQEVDGVETTHYTVTVDTRKALEAQGMAGQVPLGRVPETITYDVWVGADNLVRRLRMDVQGNRVDLTMSEWGEPVDIQPPPARQTTDMRQMMKQMHQSPPSARG